MSSFGVPVKPRRLRLRCDMPNALPVAISNADDTRSRSLFERSATL
jgi:hypothetical protein